MNTKKTIMSIIITIIAVAIIFGIFVYIRDVKMAEGTVSYNMYYVNSAESCLGIEKKTVNLVDDDKVMFNTVVDEFGSGPKFNNSALVLPSDFHINSKTYKDKIAYIDLQPSFDKLSPSDRILCIGAMVYTLTDMSFIEDVYVSVNGITLNEPQTNTPWKFNRESIRNNPTVNPEKTNWQVVELYFADRTGTRLASEQRSIEVKQSLSLEYQIVEQLIAGPEKNMLEKTIPVSTQIKDIKTEDGICYVNLSKEFINKKLANVTKQTTVYSIVDSLTELDSVNKVQFLIEGEKINSKKDGINFSKLFSRNEAMIR